MPVFGWVMIATVPAALWNNHLMAGLVLLVALDTVAALRRSARRAKRLERERDQQGALAAAAWGAHRPGDARCRRAQPDRHDHLERGGGRRVGPASKVLILTTFDLNEYVFAGLKAGASGFLLKYAPPGELLTAIRTVADGDARKGKRSCRTSTRPPTGILPSGSGRPPGWRKSAPFGAPS